MKICLKCGTEKDVVEFYRDKSRKDGLCSWCKRCRHKYNRTEKGKAFQRKYAQSLKGRIVVRAANRRYQKTEKSKAARNRFFSIFKNRLNHRISVAIRHSLKGNKKGNHWENLVDFNLQKLLTHLERQFKDGMNWNNHGDWHIDHIKPISSFNFNSFEDEEFKECWTLNNLQPLWAKENLSKGGEK